MLTPKVIKKKLSKCTFVFAWDLSTFESKHIECERKIIKTVQLVVKYLINDFLIDPGSQCFYSCPFYSIALHSFQASYRGSCLKISSLTGMLIDPVFRYQKVDATFTKIHLTRKYSCFSIWKIEDFNCVLYKRLSNINISKILSSV